MASMKNYPSPHPNPNSNLNLNTNPETEVEVAALVAPKQLTGARPRKSGRYAAEICHGSQRFWLGTFHTANEAGVAYDMAAMRLRSRTYNLPVDANGTIITTIDLAKQDCIEEQVERKLLNNTGLVAENVDHKAETSRKRKMAPKSSKAMKKREVDEKGQGVGGVSL